MLEFASREFSIPKLTVTNITFGVSRQVGDVTSWVNELSQVSVSRAKALSVTRSSCVPLSASVRVNLPPSMNTAPQCDTVSPVSDSPSVHISCNAVPAVNTESCSVTSISADWGSPANNGAKQHNKFNNDCKATSADILYKCSDDTLRTESTDWMVVS